MGSPKCFFGHFVLPFFIFFVFWYHFFYFVRDIFEKQTLVRDTKSAFFTILAAQEEQTNSHFRLHLFNLHKIYATKLRFFLHLVAYFRIFASFHKRNQEIAQGEAHSLFPFIL